MTTGGVQKFKTYLFWVMCNKQHFQVVYVIKQFSQVRFI